jgi:hypothetical protein
VTEVWAVGVRAICAVGSSSTDQLSEFEDLRASRLARKRRTVSRETLMLEVGWPTQGQPKRLHTISGRIRASGGVGAGALRVLPFLLMLEFR